jgi:hypothetical protein
MPFEMKSVDEAALSRSTFVHLSPRQDTVPYLVTLFASWCFDWNRFVGNPTKFQILKLPLMCMWPSGVNIYFYSLAKWDFWPRVLPENSVVTEVKKLIHSVTVLARVAEFNHLV